MSGNTDNVALKVGSLKKIKPYAVEYNQITGLEGFKMDLDLLDSAVNWNNNGRLNWNGRRLNWQLGPGQEAAAKVEDGEWVLYDSDGSEIFPV